MMKKVLLHSWNELKKKATVSLFVSLFACMFFISLSHLHIFTRPYFCIHYQLLFSNAISPVSLCQDCLLVCFYFIFAFLVCFQSIIVSPVSLCQDIFSTFVFVCLLVSYTIIFFVLNYDLTRLSLPGLATRAAALIGFFSSSLDSAANLFLKQKFAKNIGPQIFG